MSGADAEWSLALTPPDFSVMDREKLEDYAAHADYHLRLISQKNVSFEQKLLDFLCAVRIAAREEGRKIGSITASQARLVQSLGRGVSSRESLMAALYRHSIDAGDIKIIDVFICKVRPVLAIIGCPIETVWGQGYRIPEREQLDCFVDVYYREKTLPELHLGEGVPRKMVPTTAEQIETIIAAIMKGETERQAAIAAGVNASTVTRILSRARKAGQVFPQRTKARHRSFG